MDVWCLEFGEGQVEWRCMSRHGWRARESLLLMEGSSLYFEIW